MPVSTYSSCIIPVFILLSLVCFTGQTTTPTSVNNTSNATNTTSGVNITRPLPSCFYCDNRTESDCPEFAEYSSVCRHPDAGCYIERVIQEGNVHENYLRTGCLCPGEVSCILENFEKQLERGHSCVKLEMGIKRFDSFRLCRSHDGSCIDHVLPNHLDTTRVRPRRMGAYGSRGRSLYDGGIHLSNKEPPLRRNNLPYRMMLCNCTGNFCNSFEFWNRQFKEEDWFAKALDHSVASQLGRPTSVLIMLLTFYFVSMSRRKKLKYSNAF